MSNTYTFRIKNNYSGGAVATVTYGKAGDKRSVLATPESGVFLPGGGRRTKVTFTIPANGSEGYFSLFVKYDTLATSNSAGYSYNKTFNVTELNEKATKSGTTEFDVSVGSTSAMQVLGIIVSSVILLAVFGLALYFLFYADVFGFSGRPTVMRDTGFSEIRGRNRFG
jgi:hypothetical protein